MKHQRLKDLKGTAQSDAQLEHWIGKKLIRGALKLRLVRDRVSILDRQ